MGAAFIDFSKEFDTVYHSILIRKLDLIAIIGKSLEWTKDYLINRKQVNAHATLAVIQQGGAVIILMAFHIVTIIFWSRIYNLPTHLRGIELVSPIIATMVIYIFHVQ